MSSELKPVFTLDIWEVIARHSAAPEIAKMLRLSKNHQKRLLPELNLALQEWQSDLVQKFLRSRREWSAEIVNALTEIDANVNVGKNLITLLSFFRDQQYTEAECSMVFKLYDYYLYLQGSDWEALFESFFLKSYTKLKSSGEEIDWREAFIKTLEKKSQNWSPEKIALLLAAGHHDIDTFKEKLVGLLDHVFVAASVSPGHCAALNGFQAGCDEIWRLYNLNLPEHHDQRRSLLCGIRTHRSCEELELIIQQNGMINLGEHLDGWPDPLTEACRYGHFDAARMLLASRDVVMCVALESMCAEGNLRAVRFLMENKAEDSGIDVNTCFANACENGHIDVAEYFLSLGPDVVKLFDFIEVKIKHNNVSVSPLVRFSPGIQLNAIQSKKLRVVAWLMNKNLVFTFWNHFSDFVLALVRKGNRQFLQVLLKNYCTYVKNVNQADRAVAVLLCACLENPTEANWKALEECKEKNKSSFEQEGMLSEIYKHHKTFLALNLDGFSEEVKDDLFNVGKNTRDVWMGIPGVIKGVFPEIYEKVKKSTTIDWKGFFLSTFKKAYGNLPPEILEMFMAVKNKNSKAFKKMARRVGLEGLDVCNGLGTSLLLYTALSRFRAGLDIFWRLAVNRYTDPNELLAWAICTHQADDVIQDIIARGANVHETKFNGLHVSPLCLVCDYGHLDALKLFVEMGQPSEQEFFEHLSARGNTEQMVALYITSYAPKIRRYPPTNLHDRRKRGDNSLNVYEGLCIACRNGHVDFVETLLNDFREIINVNALDSRGVTPLFYACARQDLNLARCLLKNGADVSVLEPRQQDQLLTMLMGNVDNDFVIKILVNYIARFASEDNGLRTKLLSAMFKDRGEHATAQYLLSLLHQPSLTQQDLKELDKYSDELSKGVLGFIYTLSQPFLFLKVEDKKVLSSRSVEWKR